MKNFAIRLVVTSVALWVAASLVGGIQLTGDTLGILWVALLFGLVNAFLKPILMLLSLPFLIFTLGLFALVVNGALLMITAGITDNLSVAGLGSAILGSIIISIVTMLLGNFLDDKIRD